MCIKRKSYRGVPGIGEICLLVIPRRECGLCEGSGIDLLAVAEHILDIHHPDDDKRGRDQRRRQQQTEEPGEDAENA